MWMNGHPGQKPDHDPKEVTWVGLCRGLHSGLGIEVDQIEVWLGEFARSVSHTLALCFSGQEGCIQKHGKSHLLINSLLFKTQKVTA